VSSPVDPSQLAIKKAPSGWRELDVPAIFAAPGMLFVPWLLLIIFLIRDRQPGVICLTPFFWLLGPVVGVGTPQFSRSRTRTALLLEAFLAGGLLGFLLGATYLVSVLVAFATDPATRNFALISGLVLIVAGMVSCALLAGGVAALALRRLKLDDDP
jgi:hypothetical protein